jgi:hypothetical protein
MRRRMLFPSPARQIWSLLILSCCLAAPIALVSCGQSPGTLGVGGNAATPSPTWTPGQVVPTQPTLDVSCPMSTPQPGIFAPSLPTQGYAGAFVDNSTAVMPTDQPRYEYWILAGNRKANPQQGLLIVQRYVRDPCADATPNDGTVWTYYDTPFQQGHVQLTGVVGDTVTFTTRDGGSTVHRFDFVTGQFL